MGKLAQLLECSPRLGLGERFQASARESQDRQLLCAAQRQTGTCCVQRVFSPFPLFFLSLSDFRLLTPPHPNSTSPHPDPTPPVPPQLTAPYANPQLTPFYRTRTLPNPTFTQLAPALPHFTISNAFFSPFPTHSSQLVRCPKQVRIDEQRSGKDERRHMKMKQSDQTEDPSQKGYPWFYIYIK